MNRLVKSHRGYEFNFPRWEPGLWDWLHDTFGPMGNDWDSYEEWLFIKNDEALLLFVLKWSNKINGLADL
ncbi:MAG TPA: hypothetical protein VFM18_18975 [Methanosarcina sp.]|nr:hypothetical protein [Methanosarcina sp.]